MSQRREKRLRSLERRVERLETSAMKRYLLEDSGACAEREGAKKDSKASFYDGWTLWERIKNCLKGR